MANKDFRQAKWGALFSYVLIIANAAFGLVVSPFILDTLGESDYGVYKSVGALVSSMAVLDLGIGGTLMRYIAKYRTEGRKDKIGDFVSMMAAETGVLLLVAGGALGVLYGFVHTVFDGGFTGAELGLAQRLFLLQAVSLLLHIISNFVNGIITGYNNFILGNGTKLFRLLVKIVLTYLLLYFVKDVLVLVYIEIGLTLAVIAVEGVYAARRYGIRLNASWRRWDRGVLKESALYTFLLFLTTVAAQVNNNLDNVVVGAYMGSEAVTVYSFGLMLFAMYEQLSTSISGVMLPTVTALLKKEHADTEVQKVIVRSGRIQFALLGGALVGFAVIGKDFLRLWLGEGFEDVYYIALILMVPSLFELCVNVCLSVLRAKNMLGFRTGILMASTALNAVVTVVGVRLFNYYAAAIGTALSFLIGSVVVMNVYYRVKLGYPMLRIYGRIVSRTWLCLLLAGGVLLVSSRYLTGTWTAFVLNVLIFCTVYIILLLLYGLSYGEKKHIPILNKMLKKRQNNG